MTLLKNARIVDGTGKPAFSGDVLLENDTIKQVGNNLPCCENTVDLNGKTLCPGFIDIHSHSELEALRHPSMPNKVIQGITTDVSGNCGVGIYPRKAEDKPVFQDILGHCDKWNWTDFASFKSVFKSGINMGFLQPHSNLRYQAMGSNASREATHEEVRIMCDLLDKSLTQGCLGFSTGLYYAPCIFADRYELKELLKVVKKHNAMFAVHHRCEGDEVLSSLDEVISLAEETGVQLEISHLKAIGKDNQYKVPLMLEKIHSAQKRGVNVAFDQYPYDFGSTSLFSLLPPDLLRLEQPALLERLTQIENDPKLFKETVHQIDNPDGWDSIVKLCGFENITALLLESNPQFNGMTLQQCAQKMNLDPYMALLKLLSMEKGAALMKDTTQTVENLELIMQDELMSFGTDSLYSGELMHPRSTEAAVHLLSTFVYGKKVLSEEEAIHRMTEKNAVKLGLKDRGRIAAGYKADIVVYSPETVKKLDYVLINGTFALKNGTLTGSVSGCTV